MKVLFIADCLYQESNGAKQSANVHMNTLYKLVGKDNVTVIALTGKKDVNDDKVITYKGYSNQVMLFLNAILGYTTYTNRKIENEIIKKHLTKEYDVVFIDNSFFGRLAKKIKEKFPDILLVSYYHDVKQHLCKEWIKKNSIFKIPLFKTMMKNERINQQYCDVNLTLNKRESELYKLYYGSEPTAELGVCLNISKDSFKKYEITVDTRQLEVLFVGAYYYPNVNGILWFINEVMPLLKIPIKLTIVGNGMEKIRETNNIPDNVQILGWVESLAEFYEKSDVVIAPIFEGGGMKVKTAEAFGYGKAVIGTSESFIGYIENVPSDLLRQIIYLCDKKQEFIDALEDILDKRRIKKYNPEIRAIFEKYYSSESACSIIENILNY